MSAFVRWCNKMEIDVKKEDKGKLFVRRVQQVLKNNGNLTVGELLDKIEEMKDLMITLAKMLRHTTQKMKKLEMERNNLFSENKTIHQLMNEMEHHLNNVEDNSSKLNEKCHQFDELKVEYDKLKNELNEVQRYNESYVNDAQTVSSSDKRKSKKTQTNFQKSFGKTFMRFENGFPIFDEVSSDVNNEKYDWNIHKLQTFLLHKEQTWHQLSGREREQRMKLGRMIKEMKILQNQLDWKNNQLSHKETEVLEKTRLLTEAERKISDLKKYIRHNKRSKTVNESNLFME